METGIATVDSSGAVSLPIEAQRLLELHEGSRLSVKVEGNKLLLEPLENDPARPSHEAVRAAIRELQEAFAEGPSLEDEYRRTRDRDRW